MSRKELFMNAVRPVNAPMTKFILGRHYNADLMALKNEPVQKVLVLAPHMDDETIGPAAPSVSTPIKGLKSTACSSRTGRAAFLR